MKIVLILTTLLLTLTTQAETQLGFFGLSLHAMPTQNMDGALDDAGILAFNPQFNYFKAEDDGKIFHTGILLDCFRHPAGFISWGKRYQVDTNLYLGYELGIYARQVPKDDALAENRFARVGIYQVIPTPAFIAQYKFGPRVYIRAQTNILINFFDVGFEF